MLFRDRARVLAIVLLTVLAFHPATGQTGPANNPTVAGGAPVVEVNGRVLLTATVSPAANPDSSGLRVRANLRSIGGPGAQIFFDDGSNGDLIANDNVFSFSYSLPANLRTGTYTLAVEAVDGQARGGTGTITLTLQPHPEIHRINELQGPGAATPIAPERFIQTTGIVTARKTNGVFIQSLPSDVDGDANTSEGIFVYTAGVPPPEAAVKNVVEVRGYVHEFGRGNRANTEICGDTLCTVPETITKIGAVTDLPSPVAITVGDENALRRDPNSLALERYEGMRVAAPSLTAVAPTGGLVDETTATATSNGIFYAVVTGVARPFRKPGIPTTDALPPGAPCCIPRFDGNPEVLRIDSGGQAGAEKLEVTSNAVVTGVVGVLDFGGGSYTIVPDPEAEIAVTGDMAPVPAPVATAHEVTVASFNLERFYDDNAATPADITLTPEAFQTRLAKASIAIRTLLNTPDIVAIEEVKDLATLEALSARISSDTLAAGESDPAYRAHLAEGNDPSFVNVGFLVKPARIEVAEVAQQGKEATYINPKSGQPELVNDHPPLVLRAVVKPSGKEMPIALAVIANHLRSLAGVDDAEEGPRVRAKRAAGAEFLANLIQGMRTENVVAVGDYSAYEFSDGYVDVVGTVKGTPAPANEVMLSTSWLVSPPLVDLLATLPQAERYSYSQDGSAEALDHFLVNANALAHVTRFAYARMDADFPESVRGDATRAERVSDHDPGVAYLAVPVDNEAPRVAVTGAANGAVYALGKVTAGCDTTDAVAGVAITARLTLTGGNRNGTGHFTATCSGAVDKVGNAAAPVSVRFTVK